MGKMTLDGWCSRGRARFQTTFTRRRRAKKKEVDDEKRCLPTKRRCWSYALAVPICLHRRRRRRRCCCCCWWWCWCKIYLDYLLITRRWLSVRRPPAQPSCCSSVCCCSPRSHSPSAVGCEYRARFTAGRTSQRPSGTGRAGEPNMKRIISCQNKNAAADTQLCMLAEPHSSKPYTTYYLPCLLSFVWKKAILFKKARISSGEGENDFLSPRKRGIMESPALVCLSVWYHDN